MKGNILAQLVTLAEEHEAKALAIRTTIALLHGPTNGTALAALPGKFAQALRLEESSNGNGNGHGSKSTSARLSPRPFGAASDGTLRSKVEAAAIACWQEKGGGPFTMHDFLRFLAARGVRTSGTYVSQILRAGGCVSLHGPGTPLWPPPAPGAPVRSLAAYPKGGRRRRTHPERDTAQARQDANRRSLDLWQMFGSHPIERALVVEKLKERMSPREMAQAHMALGALVRYGYLKPKKGGLVQGKTYVPRYVAAPAGQESASA